MKEFEIPYQGAKAKLLVDDQPRAGVILKITKPPIVTYKVGQAMPDINFEEYFVYLATTLIKEAPWPIQNVDTVRNLPFDTFNALCTVLGNEFPLEAFLSPVLRLVYGRKLDQESPSQTESTLKPSSAESPSDR